MPLGGRDAPLPVELGIGQGGHEAPHDALGLGEASDIRERGLRLDLHLDPAGELGELLAELAEDLAQAPLDRPLLPLDVGGREGRRGLGRHGG
jgi:hypothetical protein